MQKSTRGHNATCKTSLWLPTRKQRPKPKRRLASTRQHVFISFSFFHCPSLEQFLPFFIVPFFNSTGTLAGHHRSERAAAAKARAAASAAKRRNLNTSPRHRTFSRAQLHMCLRFSTTTSNVSNGNTGDDAFVTTM